MALIALEDCVIAAVPPVTGGTFSINPSTLSINEKINGKKICVDGLQVVVAGTAIPGYVQQSPVTVTFSPKIIKGTTFSNKCPLALNEEASVENVVYVNLDSSTTATLTIMIADVKQTNASAT